MSIEPSLRIAVENLGPIRSGTVELKPLTILIGRNNSGKSYFAQLLYSLCKAFHDRMRLSPYRIADRSQDLAIRAMYGYLGRTIRDSPDVVMSQLPDGLRQLAMESFQSFRNDLVPSIDASLHEYFGVDSLREIVRSGARDRQMSVTLDGDMLSFQIGADGTAHHSLSLDYPDTVHITRDDLDSLQKAGLQPLETDWPHFLATRMWLGALVKHGLPTRNVLYVPSYRSGLLQSFDLIFRSLLRGLTPDRLQAAASLGARPSGILADFIDGVVRAGGSSADDVDDAIRPAVDLLEDALMEGKAKVGDVMKGESFVSYQRGASLYPLSLASSMVAELASIDVLLRGKIRPGDLVIIDEPEAHLHPENQRLIARFIIRLVRSGVRVVCPTHSSLFIHQVSNHLLASSATAETRSNLGLEDADTITEDDLGVYLFAKSSRGTRIRRVPIEPGFGIPEEEFLQVVEEIGKESFVLSGETTQTKVKLA